METILKPYCGVLLSKPSCLRQKQRRGLPIVVQNAHHHVLAFGGVNKTTVPMLEPG